MKLMTKKLATLIPALYSQENSEDPIVYAKFYTPWSNWTWYVTEFDGIDLFFGLVQGLEQEFGYFSLSELESVTGPFGLKIEREIFFTPTPLRKLLGHSFDN